MQSKSAMFLLGATLALGFSFSAYIIGQAAVKVTSSNNIKVKGSSVRSVRSDFAHWNGSFSVKDPELANATKRLESSRLAVEAYLKKAGFKQEEISFGRIGIQEIYKLDPKGYQTREVQYYLLSQSVHIASAQIQTVERVSRESTDLIRDGIVFRSESPSYIISDLDKYKMELLAEATKNAAERAEVLAKNSKGTVGALISATQGVFQITAPASSDISGYGEYDKSTILKEVKAVVTLEFRVESK